ncbi:MAG TPA: GyrI-like domain-containing protein [Paludibaculum sp.]|jgi:effector-binding domain-containing protein
MSVPQIQQRDAQPAVVMRTEAPPGGVGAALDRLLPAVFAHIQQLGGTPGGAPFTRFLGFAAGGLMIIEVGVPTLDALPSSSEVTSIVLDGGPCVTLLHAGTYDALPACHAQLDEWFETTGRRPAGYRWEAYITDPGGDPDPSTWHTLITQALEPQE